MTLQKNIILIFVSTFFKLVSAPQPGTFFWKPRLGLDLSLPTTESVATVLLPSHDTIENGLVVLINGYQAGITLIATCATLGGGNVYLYQNPLTAYYYTDMWRWFLRYLSLIPPWLGGTGGHFCETHKVWKRRFYYTQEFIPKWISNILLFVDKSSWENELRDFRNFRRYALPTFGKHFRYPKKRFDNFESQFTDETKEHDIPSALSEGAPE